MIEQRPSKELAPTLEQLHEYAYAIKLWPRNKGVPVQMLDVLRNQVIAAWNLRTAHEPFSSLEHEAGGSRERGTSPNRSCGTAGQSGPASSLLDTAAALAGRLDYESRFADSINADFRMKQAANLIETLSAEVKRLRASEPPSADPVEAAALQSALEYADSLKYSDSANATAMKRLARAVRAAQPAPDALRGYLLDATSEAFQRLLDDCANCDGAGWVMNCGADPSKSYSHSDECTECAPLRALQPEREKRRSLTKSEPTAEGALKELRQRLGLPGETSAGTWTCARCSAVNAQHTDCNTCGAPRAAASETGEL